MSNDSALGDRLIRLAAAVDSQEHVDWAAAERDAVNEEERRAVQALRVVSDVARVAVETSTGSNSAAALTTRPQFQLAPGTTWGPVVVSHEIARGSFGIVYQGTDNLGRNVALKLLDPEAQAVTRLEEARMLARVSHENVVKVYGADQIGGHVGLWMEYVDGRTLEDELGMRGRFSSGEAALVGIDLCRALAAVHGAHLRHGDIKARNVMRTGSGRIVLMDFGAGSDLSDAASDEAHIAFGTPLYMAPERFGDEPLAKTGDIYSLGVLLYHLVTKDYPVQGRTRLEVERAHAAGARVRIRDARADLPTEFVAIVERAIAHDPAARFQTAGEFEAALAHAAGGTPAPTPTPTPPPIKKTSRRAATWAVGALGLLLLSVVGLRILAPELFGGRVIPRPTPPRPVVTDGNYDVEAVFYKVSGGGGGVPLMQGSQVRPGDRLYLEMRASTPVHAYVINQDERGESYLLFPLPDHHLQNPLSPGVLHRLPGRRDNEFLDWQVTSAGGREHFVVFVSPERLDTIESLVRGLPQPQVGRPVTGARLSASAIGALRGVGGLATSPNSSVNQTDLFQGATRLSGSRESAHGVWVRQITFENPSR